jgi:outer membrane protein assembly factor BamB
MNERSETGWLVDSRPQRRENTGARSKRMRVALAGAVAAAAVAVVAACGGDSEAPGRGGSEASGRPGASWLKPNADDANTRVASSSTIDAGNVSDLRLAWARPLTGRGPFGFFATTPLIDENGITYVQDLASNVFAYDLETGKKLWEATYDRPSFGPNGLAYEDGRLYGVTDRDVFALDAATGEETWKRTIVTDELRFPPVEGQSVGLTIQPAVRDGVLYLAEAAKAGGGDLLALDAADGSQIWTFDTTEEPSGDRTPSGGAWSTPALDDEGNVYFGVGNGYYSHNAPKRLQNARLYTNSALKLDAATGELDWHYQAAPNDFYDWDLHLSPLLAEHDGRNLAIVSGKLGVVYALDRDSGEMVWKTPVGKHNGHDDDGRRQLEGRLDLKLPFELYPGALGGVVTNLALSDGVVYAAAINVPSPVKTPADLDKPVLPLDFAKGSGAIVALELATGVIRWQRDIPQIPFGAITVSNDLLFTTTFDGKVRAYSIGNGTEVWTGDLGGGTNTPLAIAGDTLVTAASFPQGPGQKAQLVVYKLNASG